MKLISVVVPCYNEEENVFPFYEEFMKNKPFLDANDMNYEILYIDDGCRDHTADKVKELIEKDRHIRLISFSRNFGKEAGIYAGLSHARGDYVCMMDADLQDPPALLPELYKAVTEEGYDCAATRRVDRKGEPPIRSFFARRFYALMKKFSDADLVDGARDYRLMTRQMVDAVLSMQEYNRFSKGIFGWIGFRTKWIEFENIERLHGETKWNFWSLFAYAVDGIIDFSSMPLTFAAVMGFVLSFVAIVMLVFVFLRAAIFGDPVAGWPSTICIMLLIAGLQMLMLGVIGQYLSKTYLEVKRRPIYILREELGGEAAVRADDAASGVRKDAADHALPGTEDTKA